MLGVEKVRRHRFGGLQGRDEAGDRNRVMEALFFDIRSPDNEESETIAAQRAAQLEHVPLLLAVAHLLCGLVVLFNGRGDFGPISPGFLVVAVGIALAADLGAFAMLHFRTRFRLSPRTTTLALSILIGVASAMMTFFGHIASWIPAMGNGPLLSLVIGTSITAGAVVAIESPPLAIVSAIVGTGGSALFSNDPIFTAGIAFLALIVVGFSGASARTMIATARERLKLDHEAHKALHFVNEFENSGRGWFWETNYQGTLSYVSQQLADDFQCEPEALLGRQFTDLLSVDTSPGDIMREERTLGFHLSARFPFSDVVVRAASAEDVHWSLSGNPVFDERGRFLGFRGIGTD
ncbi:MAG TPA: PAS domain-containing protein, partial [Sphingomicrobium sp.]|nr:PAS domain-containing protein [Sphingomicrobium sp.]